MSVYTSHIVLQIINDKFVVGAKIWHAWFVWKYDKEFLLDFFKKCNSQKQLQKQQQGLW